MFSPDWQRQRLHGESVQPRLGGQQWHEWSGGMGHLRRAHRLPGVARTDVDRRTTNPSFRLASSRGLRFRLMDHWSALRFRRMVMIPRSCARSLFRARSFPANMPSSCQIHLTAPFAYSPDGKEIAYVTKAKLSWPMTRTTRMISTSRLCASGAHWPVRSPADSLKIASANSADWDRPSETSAIMLPMVSNSPDGTRNQFVGDSR